MKFEILPYVLKYDKETEQLATEDSKETYEVFGKMYYFEINIEGEKFYVEQFYKDEIIDGIDKNLIFYSFLSEVKTHLGCCVEELITKLGMR